MKTVEIGHKTRFFSVFLALCTLFSSAAAEIVTSIKPLELLARDLLPDAVSSVSLLNAADSPHHYALKPRDMLRLSEADLFIWVGPSLEQFLVKAVEQRVNPQRQFSLQALLPEESDDHHDDDSGHEHAADAHIWLSFTGSEAIATAVAARFIELMPNDAELIEAKLAPLLSELQHEKQTALAVFAKSESGFGVYHDAYGHYVDELGLKQLAHVNVLPDQQPSVRQLYELKKQLNGAACLMADVGEAPAAEKLANKLNLPLSTVDLLASQELAVVRSSHYVAYLQAVRLSFERCLFAGEF